MSTFAVKIYPLTISAHPNADLLELAQVGDYLSVVAKGQFKTGDLGAYIPEGAIVPQAVLVKLNLVDKLAGTEKNRVKAVKLRGILSQGIVYPVQQGAYSKTEVLSYNSGKETVSGQAMHIREGIVVRPIQERQHPELGRCILKSVSEEYLLRKGGTEFN